jgi:uncharacterized membrane protein YfcA
MNELHTLAGFGVGILVGLTGVGGGALMTPLLVLLFGVAPVSAVGTDLWFAALTKTAGGAMHHSRGSVDWEVMRRLSAGSLPTAIATLAWLHFTGGSQLHDRMLMTALGGVLVLTSVAMLLKQRTHKLGTHKRRKTPEAFKRMQPALTVLAGAILGFLVTLTSIGAGALGAVMLLYLYPIRMKPSTLVGTDIVHAIPLTIVAGIGHLWMGNVQFSLLGSLLLGSIPGVLIGAHFSTRVPENVLRPAIAVVLMAVAIKLITA